MIEKGDVKVELGLGGVVAGESWNRFRVLITNRGADFRGTMEVRGIRTMPHLFIPDIFYEAEIELPGVSPDGDTTTREMVFPVLPARWGDIEVSIRGRGFRRTFTFDPPLLSSHTYRILAAGEKVPDLSALLEEIDSFLENQEEEFWRVHAAHLASIESQELPDFPAALDPFRVVLLWGTRLADTSPEAIEALERWVETGGVLVAFPPAAAGWGAAIPEKVRRLLGLDLIPPNLSRDGFVTARRGLGVVTTLAKSPEGKRFPTRKEDPQLYRRIESSLKRPATLAGRRADRGFRSMRYGFMGLWEIHGDPFPKRGAVGGALLLYLLGGFLLPAMVLRRLRRPEWTPVAILGAAGIATLGIYFWGLLSSLEAPEIDEVTVLRVHPDGKKADATSQILLVSPNPVRVDWTDSGSLPKPLQAALFEPCMPIFEPVPLRVSGRRVWMDAFDLPPMEKRYFRVEHEGSMDGLGEIAPLGPASAGVRVKNLSRRPLWAFRVAKDRFTVPPEAIAPGSLLPVGASPGAIKTLRTSDAVISDSPFRDESLPTEFQAISAVLKWFVYSFPRDRVEEPPQKEDGSAGTVSEEEWSTIEPPHYLILATEEPVFPAVKGFPVRKAVTVILYELPQPSAAATPAKKGE